MRTATVLVLEPYGPGFKYGDPVQITSSYCKRDRQLLARTYECVVAEITRKIRIIYPSARRNPRDGFIFISIQLRKAAKESRNLLGINLYISHFWSIIYESHITLPLFEYINHETAGLGLHTDRQTEKTYPSHSQQVIISQLSRGYQERSNQLSHGSSFRNALISHRHLRRQ